MKKILVLYTSVGLGHKSIAENIGYHLQKAGYEVKLHDVLQLQAGLLVNVWIAIQQFINRRLPFIWKWLYIHTDHGWLSELTLSSRVKAASRNYQQIKKVIDEFQPDLVIATQTTASAVVQFGKQHGWYKGLFAIAFSDYHLHRYWLYDAADFYLANIEEQKAEMARLGIPPEKIFVLGITLRPRPAIDTAAVRRKLGISGTDKVVLAASGSLGYGMPTSWFVKLAGIIKSMPQTKLIIVCGKNRSLEQALKHQIGDYAIVTGYYSPLAELYAISDIFLTKPGGLSIAEALQWQLPLLITHWLPGQEEINFGYLAAKQVVMPRPVSVEPRELGPVIAEELSQHAFRQSLISNATAAQLSQSGQEGLALVTAVDKAFHKV